MRVVVVPLLVVVLPIVGAAVATALNRSRAASPALDSRQYRLLQRSARVLERILHDDLTSRSLSEPARAEAQAIVDEFYDDDR